MGVLRYAGLKEEGKKPEEKAHEQCMQDPYKQ
jgi:hypothetical protein